MTDTYKIGNVCLRFKYIYDKYFASRIRSYKSDESPEYQMRVVIKKDLMFPEGKPKYRFQDRQIYEDGQKGVIVKHDDKNNITHLITYSLDFKDILIELSESLGSRLAEVEYKISGMMFFEIAIRNGLIPIHASAIGYQDEAILFCGSSGTGKSTQAELWKQNLDEVIFINDDKPLLYEAGDGLYVTGSPWSGKTSRNENVKMKVKAIVFIKQAPHNNLISLTVYDKITNFLRNIYRPREEAKIENVLELIEKMISDLPVYKYYCTKENDSFEYLYQALYRRDY
ncbi:MAG: hypothetical protein ACOX16_01765 [Candidatus Izemoplasmatales bacterium]|jgi:hypothetical protein